MSHMKLNSLQWHQGDFYIPTLWAVFTRGCEDGKEFCHLRFCLTWFENSL